MGDGCQEGLRDLLRRQAADLSQRQRDLRIGRQRGVAAGEDQPQAVIGDARIVIVAAPGCFVRGDIVGLRIEGVEARLPPQLIDAAEPARRDQPGARIVRHALAAATSRARRGTRRAAPPRPGRNRRAAGSESRGRRAIRPDRSASIRRLKSASDMAHVPPVSRQLGPALVRAAALAALPAPDNPLAPFLSHAGTGG